VAAGWHNIFMNEFRFFMLMLDILPEWITALALVIIALRLKK